MQASYVQQGNSLDYTPGAAVAAGQVVVQNSLVGVATHAIDANTLGALDVTGVFDMVKVTGAISAGQRLYWSPTGNPVSGTAGSGAISTNPNAGPFAGLAAAAAGANDPTVRVSLAGNVVRLNPLANVIADPGNAGAIPVTDSGSVQFVTTAAQTRTLAVPNHVGQQLALSLKTDGGDCVITVAAAINQTGNNTITLNDAGDTILLLAIESGANLRWRVVANDGCSLTTV